MQLITTNNYFADLATAVEANLFTRNGRNPKKDVLYAAIEAHNVKTAKPANVVKSAKIVSRGISVKSLNKTEVWHHENIRVVKRSSQMGRVLEYMFNNDGVEFVETDGLELTKAQFIQAIGSISEAGYGIVKTAERFTVILPKKLEAPKLK